jgi:hypothetical protein
MCRFMEHCVSSLTVGYRVISCGICGERSGTGKGAPPSTLVLGLLRDRNSRFLLENKKKHVLSTTVQILDVITSFNLNCYPVMMDQPRAAILFRRHGN